MVRASGYKSRGPGFDYRLYHGDFPCGGRIPVVTMIWVVSRIRFKVETSVTRSHTSINSWLNPRQRSPRWRGPHHERQTAHQRIEYPGTLIVDYGRKKKSLHSAGQHRGTKLLDDWWNGVRYGDREKILFSPPYPDLLRGPSSLLSYEYWGCYPAGKSPTYIYCQRSLKANNIFTHLRHSRRCISLVKFKAHFVLQSVH